MYVHVYLLHYTCEHVALIIAADVNVIFVVVAA